ncbi:MAG: division/cell wall cluster transcriptional repressor MraZ [Bacilli bacterium]|nr:division/cell wall cluster transcriptional repressor MraZ [Bacilli bacterium]
MLMGEYHHSIDEKNRLIIPSKFRNELGNSFVLTRGLDKCLFIYSLKEWEKIISKLRTLPFTKKDSRDFTRFFLSGATECTLDKSGRVSITSPLVNYAGLNSTCVVIGANDHIEIWDKTSWENFFIENEENFANIAENLFEGE